MLKSQSEKNISKKLECKIGYLFELWWVKMLNEGIHHFFLRKSISKSKIYYHLLSQSSGISLEGQLGETVSLS